MKELKRNTIIGIVLMLIIIAAVIAVSVSGSNSASKTKTTPTPESATGTPTQAQADQTIIRGVIEGMDMENNRISILEPNSGEKIVLNFTGITDARDKYGSPVTVGHFRIGDLVEVSYDAKIYEASSIKSLTGAWEYKNVKNLWYDDTIGKMTIGDVIYRYNENLLIISGESFIDITELDDIDILDVRGIDNQICVLVVVKGHGYLALDDYSSFDGGTMYIGAGRTEIISQDAKLKLREGEYEVMIQKGEYSGFETIKITRGETALFPASEFGPEPVPMGRLTFKIRPEGAELYIDGVKTLYSEAVELTYGFHEIEVSLGGYTTYKGSAEVSRTDETVNIILAENSYTEDGGWPDVSEVTPTPYEDDEPTPTVDGVPTPTPYDYEDISETPEATPEVTEEPEPEPTVELLPTPTPVANNNRLIVRCTDGTSIYVDGEYIGDIENGQLSVAKIVGSINLTLRKDGYVTKSYTVYVEEGTEDAVFSFPDMVPE